MFWFTYVKVNTILTNSSFLFTLFWEHKTDGIFQLIYSPSNATQNNINTNITRKFGTFRDFKFPEVSSKITVDFSRGTVTLTLGLLGAEGRETKSQIQKITPALQQNAEPCVSLFVQHIRTFQTLAKSQLQPLQKHRAAFSCLPGTKENQGTTQMSPFYPSLFFSSGHCKL